MAKYEQHANEDGKFQCPLCDYAHAKGKTRQSVSRHYKLTHEKKEPTPPKTTPEEPEDEAEIEAVSEPIEIEEPSWLKVEFGEDVEGVVHSIPAPVRGLLQSLQNQGSPDHIRKPEQLREFYASQAKLVRFFLAGVVDPTVSWYGRGITADETFTIERSEDEWVLTEAVTAQWLEYRQISMMVNPDILMAGTLTALYLPPIYRIGKNRDPSRPKWSLRGMVTRFKQRRAMKKAIKENPLNEDWSETNS